jgi:prevent-host-death family protein
MQDFAMTQVNIHQAKTNLSRLIAEAEAGGDVIISRGNIPVAKLIALSKAEKTDRVPGIYAHLGPVPESFFEPLPEDELMAWEGGFERQATSQHIENK